MPADAFTDDEIRGVTVLTQDKNGKDVYSNDKVMFGYMESAKFLVVTKPILAAMRTYWSGTACPAFTTENMGQRMAFQELLKNHRADYASTTAPVKPYLVYGTTAAEELELEKVTVLNYVALRSAGLVAKDAYAVAALRSRWIALGCLYTGDADKHVDPASPFSEVVVAERDPTAAADSKKALINNVLAANTKNRLALGFPTNEAAKEFLALAKDENTGNSFAVKYAEIIWCIVEYMFRTRGHHYKVEYLPLIAKMLDSGFSGDSGFDKSITPSEIFHTAIHPFGVKYLPLMAFHFALHSKLGSAILLRFEAAPNGCAVITTTYAALNSLKTEPWYKAFYNAMKSDIEVVEALAKAILSDKYAYHMSASLYGATKKNMITVNSKEYTIEDAKSTVAPVATVVQGFINYLDRMVEYGSVKGFSLSNAKSLQKHAATNPTLAMKVAHLCDIVTSQIQNVTEVTKATGMVFPALSELQVQKEALPSGTAAVPAITN